ncbi:MAG: toxin co-regulated pilus biosynthesis Q family protein [Thiomonas sp.]
MQRPLFKLAVATALVCSLPAAMADVLPGQAQSAGLLTALALIVPQPYEINVDNSIPTDTRLSWGEQGDWEQQLRQAAESAGLGVRFNAPAHVLLIFRLPRIHRVTIGLPAAPAQASSPGMPAAAAPATLTLPEPRATAQFPTMQPAPSIASRGEGWSMPAPAMPTRAVHLIDAIQILMPPRLAPILQLEVLAANLNAPVHWAVGTRWDALQSMLRRMGLQAHLDGKTLRIAPMAESLPEATAPQQTVVPQHPSVPTAVPAAMKSIPAFKPIPLWTLKANQAISVGLDAWAHASGWKVVWNVPQDWLVPNTVQFQGDFRAAATQVIQALAANGADIRADVYTANKTLVVHAAGQGA